MFTWLRNKLYPSLAIPEEKEEPAPARRADFSTHDWGTDPQVTAQGRMEDRMAELKALAPKPPKPQAEADGSVATMDTEDWNGDTTAKGYGNNAVPNISDALAQWYIRQTFIGHQLAAMIAQHWLVLKACATPARDAIRKGFTITTVDGDALPEEVLKKLQRADKKFALKKNLLQYTTFGRVFGVRIAIFKVDYGSEEASKNAYERPFNIDGVAPGSYRGIVQVDPYWCAPELDGMASSQPDTKHFFEPTYWQINGKRYHRSHLIIYRHGDVADILKPAYLYGGIPVPQLIMERIYGAERTANEAPLLALTKRTNIYKTDVAEAAANFDRFRAKMLQWTEFWTNYGHRVIGQNDEVSQIDTSLSDLDSLIMTQYQLVAAASDVPSTKLLGTSPKGFNATGEYDEANYHETLESLQEHELTPFVERHHALVLRSEGVKDIATSIVWEPLDTPTAKERAETNKIKAETATALVGVGALNGEDVRKQIANDKTSDYSSIEVAEETSLPTDEA